MEGLALTEGLTLMEGLMYLCEASHYQKASCKCDASWYSTRVQHKCYLFEGQITNDKIFHDSDYLNFLGVNLQF